MRPPDLHNKASAWLIPINREHKDWRPDWEAGIVNYLIDCPWAHPFWAQYSISGIHLRPIEGVPSPKLHFPSASHEILILSLDPKTKHDPDKLYTGEQALDFLSPPDLCHQVEGISDAQCFQLVQDIVMTVVNGHGSPDSDYREWWKRAIDATVRHLREGKHQVQ